MQKAMLSFPIMSFLKRKQLFSSLFFLYFIVYAISPLTGAFAEKRIDAIRLLPKDVALDGKSVHVFLWELIVAHFDTRDDRAHEHEKDKVLLRKVRAVLSENDLLKLPFFDDVFVSDGALPRPVHAVFSLAVGLEGPQAVRKGFQPLYSGHSPPSA